MKNGVANFKINRKYLCAVPKIGDIIFIHQDGKREKGKSYGTEDHPNFTKLRQLLEKEGYIKVEKGWWNGDKVLKSFCLNGKKFKVGEKFPCGTAIDVQLEVLKKFKN